MVPSDAVYLVCGLLLVAAMGVITFCDNRNIRKCAIMVNVGTCAVMSAFEFIVGKWGFGIVFCLLVLGNLLTLFCISRTENGFS